MGCAECKKKLPGQFAPWKKKAFVHVHLGGVLNGEETDAAACKDFMQYAEWSAPTPHEVFDLCCCTQQWLERHPKTLYLHGTCQGHTRSGLGWHM
eukprot:1155006-Pelagomonas_calceolata.AAC.2